MKTTKPFNYVIAPNSCNRQFLTPGKAYRVIKFKNVENRRFLGESFYIRNDYGELMLTLRLKSNCLNGKDWIVENRKINVFKAVFNRIGECLFNVAERLIEKHKLTKVEFYSVILFALLFILLGISTFFKFCEKKLGLSIFGYYLCNVLNNKRKN